MHNNSTTNSEALLGRVVLAHGHGGLLCVAAPFQNSKVRRKSRVGGDLDSIYTKIAAAPPLRKGRKTNYPLSVGVWFV